MTFLRGTVKMDIPDYIVSEVDDRLSDGATPQTSQDATTAAAQTVAQYSSEYEILTESEIEEKYQADPDNAEIAIEMSEKCTECTLSIHIHIHNSHSSPSLARLLGTATAAVTTTTAQAVLEDASNNAATAAGGATTAVSVTPVKNDNKAGGTTGKFNSNISSEEWANWQLVALRFRMIQSRKDLCRIAIALRGVTQ